LIDQDFCNNLERIISGAFQHLENKETRGFWCDGITLSQPESQYSKKHVNETRSVALKAFIGKDGQTEYELILKFGPKALSRYERDLSIEQCIPDPEKAGWLVIDITKRIIKLQLN
jgi:hypothetical protein